MTVMNKKELRTLLRSKCVSSEERAKESALLCKHVLNSPYFQDATTIGGYIPLTHEADVTAILQAALQQGKRLALPLCHQAPIMSLREVTSLDQLRPGAYGILEPAQDAPIVPPEQIDLLLVPLEGIDRHGFRLGKGGGYYDHYLNQVNIMTFGCALSTQWTDNIPHDSWDVQLHACADHEGIHWFTNYIRNEENYHGQEEAKD